MAEFLAHLRDPVLFAIPVFLLFVAIEIVAVHVLGHDEGVVGYSVADTRTSMLMGTVAVGVNALFRLVMLVAFAALFELAPVKFDPRDWWTWVLMLLGQELVFYAYHRASHRVRLLWAGHQVHHSSEHYNFSTALRQKWTPYFQLPFWSVLALCGIPPWMIRPGCRSTWSTSSSSTRRRSAGCRAGSSTCSTRRHTTASTTAATRSTWTRTTAAS